VKVAVIGLGYVGAVTSACLARDGHDVLGIDLDPTKLALLGQGKAPIVEADISEITKQAVESGKLVVDGSLDGRIAAADLVFVCVGTPSTPNGGQDLTAVRRVSEQIGATLRSAAGCPVIVLRSTVPPGTTEEIVLPILEEASGKTEGEDFGLCFQPEFLREGTSVKDFYNPPFTVVGGSEKAVAAVRALFREFPAEFVATSSQAAEMLKFACNTFHALKVTFANEIGRLGQSVGVDPRVVMDLLCKDHQLNISPAYLRPGFAFGGSCLPKDLRALLHVAKTHDAELPMLQGVLPSNTVHIDHAAQLVIAGKSRKIGMIGLSFKPGTDDLRESPLVGLAERLIGKGYELRIYDPAVSLALLVGSNKRFIEETIPHIGSLLTDDLDEVCRFADTIVVGHRDTQIEDALTRHQAGLGRTVDLAGIEQETARGSNYFGICW
jgi:GDP-mannose 6-dehydrogenase